jgi:hypothetical protein
MVYATMAAFAAFIHNQPSHYAQFHLLYFSPFLSSTFVPMANGADCVGAEQ